MVSDSSIYHLCTNYKLLSFFFLGKSSICYFPTPEQFYFLCYCVVWMSILRELGNLRRKYICHTLNKKVEICPLYPTVSKIHIEEIPDPSKDIIQWYLRENCLNQWSRLTLQLKIYQQNLWSFLIEELLGMAWVIHILIRCYQWKWSVD